MGFGRTQDESPFTNQATNHTEAHRGTQQHGHSKSLDQILVSNFTIMYYHIWFYCGLAVCEHNTHKRAPKKKIYIYMGRLWWAVEYVGYTSTYNIVNIYMIRLGLYSFIHTHTHTYDINSVYSTHMAYGSACTSRFVVVYGIFLCCIYSTYRLVCYC